MSEFIRYANAYYGISPLYRIVLVVGLLLVGMIAEKSLKKEAAHRWKEYTLWLAMASFGMLFGFCLNLVTLNISPAYFRIGKGVSTANIYIAALEVGGAAGFLAGICIGASILWKKKKLVQESKTIPWRLLRPLTLIALFAVIGVLAGWALPLLKEPEPMFAALLPPREIADFFRVQQMHAGAYLFATIAWIFVLFRRNRSNPP